MSIAAVQKEMEDLKAETERWKQQSNTHYMQICALDKDLADLRDKGKVLVDVEPPQFPIALRKMWSGAEVQKWIDENWSKQV
jgi:hypothetical protein